MQRTARPPEKKIPERALILAERFLIDATEMRSCPLRVVAELLPLFASAPLLDLPPWPRRSKPGARPPPRGFLRSSTSRAWCLSTWHPRYWSMALPSARSRSRR